MTTSSNRENVRSKCLVRAMIVVLNHLVSKILGKVIASKCKIYGIICVKFVDCFSIISMEKQAIKFLVNALVC